MVLFEDIAELEGYSYAQRALNLEKLNSAIESMLDSSNSEKIEFSLADSPLVKEGLSAKAETDGFNFYYGLNEDSIIVENDESTDTYSEPAESLSNLLGDLTGNELDLEKITGGGLTVYGRKRIVAQIDSWDEEQIIAYLEADQV